MGYNNPDPYSQPEDFGLQIVAILDDEMAAFDYGFYMLAVWHDDTSDTYYMATDAGCSCPAPFEYTTFDDLEPVSGIREIMRRAETMGTTNDRANFRVQLWNYGVPN